MKTTLNQIREHSPCHDGWTKLLCTLNKTKGDDEPVSIVQVLDSNGLDDALWCLRAVQGRDKEIRLFSVWCARQVQHLMTDKRSTNALDVAERFANGEASQQELADAWDDAWADALAAARDAAGAAAGADAWDDAWDDALAAARDAARDAAGADAWDDAWDDALAAARDAAGAAAGADAWDDAWDDALAAARDAARADAWDAQEKELRRICAKCEAKS